MWRIVLILFLFSMQAVAQNKFCVMELNCENLFNTEHDSLKNDTEFLPTSLRAWNKRRYWKKLAHTAQTIVAVGNGQTPPDLVALCEVENDYVMRDLTRRSPLRNVCYKYCITNSPDERGIDVALLYQPETFKLVQQESFRINFSGKHRPTRDILHVQGVLLTGDTLDILVVHLPSRAGGRQQSEPFRKQVAEVIKTKADSIQTQRTKPKVIIIGDFNDYPTSPSICNVIRAVKPEDIIDNNRYYNLMNGKTGGTYRYKGEWGILDQCIVNGLMLTDLEHLHTSYGDATICDLNFLLEPDAVYGGVKPFRTYNGIKYREGYSDHLPISVIFYY